MKLDEIKISQAIIESYKNKLTKALDVDVAIVGAGPARRRNVGWRNVSFRREARQGFIEEIINR